MPVELSAPIALRHGDRVHMGVLVRLEEAVAGVTTDARYNVGDFVEFQMELTGWGATVSGIAEVRRAGVRDTSTSRYLLQILEMRRSDRKLLESWYRDQRDAHEGESGMVAFALDSGVGSAAPPRAAPSLPRRRDAAPVTESHSTWFQERALSISQTVEHQGSRRHALRAMLRTAFREHADRDQRVPGEAPVPGPRATVSPLPGLLRVELVYEDNTSWRADWNAWLHQGLVFVRCMDRVPDLEQRALVHLLYQECVDISCPARVVLIHPTGFGLVLELDALQLDAIESVTQDAHLGHVRVAARITYNPSQEATSPASRSTWSRLFGLESHLSPLEEALLALPDPLGPLVLEPPQGRRRLDALLARVDTDYLVLCDQVARFLEGTSWRWPELEARIRGSRNPMDQAAAWIVLSHVIRADALASVRAAAATGAGSVRLHVLPGSDPSCPSCRPWHGAPLSPLDLARKGLPPFHLGCECRVTRA